MGNGFSVTNTASPISNPASAISREKASNVNGEPAGENSFPAFKALPGDTSPDDVGIGRKGSGTCFLGVLDEVRIWNRALSPEEVMEHMNMGRVDFLSVQPQSNLTGTWGHIKVSTSPH